MQRQRSQVINILGKYLLCVSVCVCVYELFSWVTTLIVYLCHYNCLKTGGKSLGMFYLNLVFPSLTGKVTKTLQNCKLYLDCCLAMLTNELHLPLPLPTIHYIHPQLLLVPRSLCQHQIIMCTEIKSENLD